MKQMLFISSLLALLAGSAMVIGGVWGVSYTYTNVVRENITTPSDASIPNTKVRGPFTLRSQAEVIRKHALKITGGKTYSEMPREIPKIDENGDTILDANGESVMVPNNARDIWITATALTTALNLGLITYAFFGLIILFGFVSIWTGLTFYIISEKH